jgi:MFS transporter, UMF1 family
MPEFRSKASWVVYDMANTVFSLGVVSLYFPLYLNGLGLPDRAFAVAASASMAVMLVLSPALGALSDAARRRVPFLVASTLVCVAATAMLGFVHWGLALALFALANVGFLAGLVFYDALLPAVSTAANRGRVGAVGVAVGYLGSLVALGTGRSILAAWPGDYQAVFVAVALLFLVLALPAFFWIREPAKEGRFSASTIGPVTRQAFLGLWRLVREPGDMSRFLVARVFYSDAVNTMILFMGIYVTTELGMAEAQVTLVLLFGILGAALASPAWGWLVDRRGAAPTLRLVLWAWALGLAGVVALPWTGLPSSTFYGLAAWLGACLGGSWSADRPLVVELSAPERVGTNYGYYGMVGRFSAIVGPLLWTVVVDTLQWGRQAAVASLLLFVLVGQAVFHRVGRQPEAARPAPQTR